MKVSTRWRDMVAGPVHSTVADKSGYTLSPIQPSLRLADISERARLRAVAARLVRFDRLADIAHIRTLDRMDNYGVSA